MTEQILKHLHHWLGCSKCGLCEHRRMMVLGEGPLPADVMFVGIGPGTSEDMMGKPFVGPSGRILREAIKDAAKLSGCAPSVFLTNLVACHPTDKSRGPNRDPSAEEVLACWPRLQETEQVVKPSAIILLGDIVKKYAGKHFKDAVHIFHPAFVVRRGGFGSTEYRKLVREIAEVFENV